MIQNKIIYPMVSNSWGHEEVRAIQKVIKSDHYTIGKNVKEFEKKFARYQDSKYCVMVNSGSSANLISIYSLFHKKKNPLKRGDEVIVPAVSWSTTYAPLEQFGLKVKVVDIDLETLNVDVKQLEKSITKKTKLIIAVSILGNPVHLDKVKKLADKNKIYFMEDNCESLGAKLGKRKTGTFGIVNTSSFFFSHHINTIEGGAVTTNDEETYHILLALREHGWTRNLPSDKFFRRNKNFEDYNFVLPGFNVRPTEINGAIGIEQLKKVDKLIRIRRKNLSLFQKLFKDDERFIIQKEIGQSSSFAFTLVLRPKFKNLRGKITNYFKKKGIAFRLITGGNFMLHPYAKKFSGLSCNSHKNASYIHNYGFFVGNHPRDISKELKYLKKTLSEI